MSAVTIPGSRVRSLPITKDGRQIGHWPCWRCGQNVDLAENVVRGAPCSDCREYLRKEEGDTTEWRNQNDTKAKAS